MMNKKQIIRWSLLAVLLLVVMNGCSSYNRMVDAQEDLDNSWGQVENVYQRRNDLIPNLIETVKDYARHEKSTFEAVIQARANATKINIDPSNMTEGQLAMFQQKQGELSGALSKLMVVMESYPELKANENYLSLQAELAGTENRIAVERKKFNDFTKDYNKRIRKFPRSIWANVFGFEKRAYFESDAGAKVAPNAGDIFRK